MANMLILDGGAVQKYVKCTGAGTDVDPFVIQKNVTGSVVITSGNIIVDSGNMNVIVDSGNIDANVTGTVVVSEAKVGKFAKEIQPALTLTLTQYSTNESVGGRLTLPNAARANGGSGVIKSLLLYDKNQQRGDYDFLFFRADPTSWTLTDNAAVVPQATDAPKLIAAIQSNREWLDYGTHSILYMPDINIPFTLDPATAAITMAIISRNTPTFSSTSGLVLTVGIEQN